MRRRACHALQRRRADGDPSLLDHVHHLVAMLIPPIIRLQRIQIGQGIVPELLAQRAEPPPAPAQYFLVEPALRLLDFSANKQYIPFS